MAFDICNITKAQGSSMKTFMKQEVKTKLHAADMAQWLRELDALPQAPSSVPSTHKTPAHFQGHPYRHLCINEKFLKS